MSDDDYPLYSTVDLFPGDDDAALAIMYRITCFHICITTIDLHGSQAGSEPSFLEIQIQQFREALDDEPGAMEAFEEWMGSPAFRTFGN